MTSNQISYFKAKEEQRHNREMEAENERSNRAQEYLKQQEIEVNRAKAAADKAHQERADAETQRANLVREQQNGVTLDQNYTKLAQEQQRIKETARNNRANEEIAWINANAAAKNASSNAVRAQSGAELDFATAGLRYAETAHTDIKAILDSARADQTRQQTNLLLYQQAATVAQTQLSRAQRDNVITQTSYIPLNTWGNLVNGAARSVLPTGKYVIGG